MGDRTLLERLDVDVRDSGDRRQFRHKPLGLADVVARRHLATTRVDDAHNSRKRRERTSSNEGWMRCAECAQPETWLTKHRTTWHARPALGLASPRLPHLRPDRARLFSHICVRNRTRPSAPICAGTRPLVLLAQMRREGLLADRVGCAVADRP